MIATGKGRPAASQAGFTLIEILVAVTLIAVIAVGLWAVFRISVRSWSRGTEFMDANQRHRSLMDMVRKQLASAHGLFVQEDPQQPGSGSLIFSGTENSLLFLSLNSLQFQESPGLTMVAYEIDRESSGDMSLVERESRFLGSLPAEGASLGSKAIPIFENLSSCLFEYYDPGDSENPPQWVQEWNAEEQGKLPAAVSLTMVSHDPKGNNFTRHMVVPIHSQPGTMRVNFVNPFNARRPVTP